MLDGRVDGYLKQNWFSRSPAILVPRSISYRGPFLVNLTVMLLLDSTTTLLLTWSTQCYRPTISTASTDPSAFAYRQCLWSDGILHLSNTLLIKLTGKHIKISQHIMKYYLQMYHILSLFTKHIVLTIFIPYIVCIWPRLSLHDHLYTLGHSLLTIASAKSSSSWSTSTKRWLSDNHAEE